MGFLDEVETRLTDQGVVGSGTNWTVSKSEMPDGEDFGDRVVALFATGGAAPETNASTEYPSLQVRVRGQPQDSGTGGYQAAETKIVEVRDTLHTFTGTLDGTTYVGVVARGDVLSLGYDERDRVELSQNFRVVRER